MKGHWEVEDGYCGKSAPQVTLVDDEDWLDTPPEDRQALLEEIVQEDFERRITFYIKHTSDEPEDDGRWDDEG